MRSALADSHIHLAGLLDRDPGFPERLPGLFEGGWACCASSHDEGEWRRVEALRSRLPPFVASFGIHPQAPAWTHADFLASLAGEGRLAAIGEAGFDFFGDRPERVRDEANERTQREVFEFQLELAIAKGLPLLLHLRKAMDLAFAYAPRLRRLPAAVFHSFPGSARDAESLVARGVNAYFSFGAPILNGNKRAAAACAAVPLERLLSETDAPWQPPRRVPPVAGDFCRAEDLRAIAAGIAALRRLGADAAGGAMARNFARAFGLPAGSPSGD